MRKSFTLLLLFFLPLFVWAQSVTVPKNIQFADIHLRISDEAQREIQKKVDALHRNPSFFRKKVELADAYFPVIERTFRELGVPEDLKYLSLQESGLVGDAVSTSNAVGYWQMKREAAMDFNLRVNNLVDERKHITEASRGAAKYFIRSNNYYNNWLNTTLSYYLGYTGAKAYAGPSDNGSKRMEITDKTNPYLLTFLAHKVAYENFIGKANSISIKELRATPGQSLAQIALEYKADPSELEKYNKWLLGSTIPSDKEYYVLLPVKLSDRDQVILASKDEKNISGRSSARPGNPVSYIKHNDLNAIVARPGDDKEMLAQLAGVSTHRFLMFNDMYSFDKIVEGAIYYTEPKRSSATTEYHIVQPGETSHQISQKHGIKLSQLLFKNRMTRSETPAAGRVMWLQKRRPSKTPVEIRNLSGKQAAAVTRTAATPSETSATANTAGKAATPKQTEPEAPKDNIFKRFIRSFDRFKRKPELKAEPVKEVNPSTVANPETKEPVEVAPEEQEEESVKVVEETTKPKEAALYPGKKTVATTEEKVQKTAKTELEPVVSEPKNEAETIRVPATSFSTQPAGNPAHHVVRQGETLYGISRMYATTVSDIVAWNNLGDTPIKAGQELLISAPLKMPEKSPFKQTETAPVSFNKDYHTVLSGETLYQISKKYQVSLDDLRNWNNLTDNNISVGQKLLITAPAEDSGQEEPETIRTNTKSSSGNESVYHTVTAGESMYQISRKYGVTIKDVMEWNNKSDFNVSLGEKLLIKK